MADPTHDAPHVPGLPEIRDEAADTPMWLPLLGLALLVLLTLTMVWRASSSESTAAGTAGEAVLEVGTLDEAGGEAAAVEADEAAPEGAEAADPHAGHGHGARPMVPVAPPGQ